MRSRPYPLLFLFISFAFCLMHCTREPAKNDDAVPWADATFLSPAITELEFTNASDQTLNFAIDLRYYHSDVNGEVADSLAPGQRATISVEIHRPRQLFYRLGNHESMRIVLPGRPRRLTYDGLSVAEDGSAKDIYDYLDRVFVPLTKPGRTPPDVSDLEAYHRELSGQYTVHTDSLGAAPTLPAWVVAMADRERNFLSLGEPIQIRAYRKFFFSDTLPVPERYVDTVRRALRQPQAYQTPSFFDLYAGLAYYLGEKDADPNAGAATNNSRALTTALINDYPVGERQNDAIAERLTHQINDQRLYAGKFENIELMTAALPPEYQREIALFTEEVVAKNSNLEGARAFLNTSFETDTGNSSTPLKLRKKPVTLYKFWFAGCYPCIVQQPAERKLLARFPQLEIIYVAFSTQKDRWLPYLEKNDPPAAANLYVPKTETKLVGGAIGQLGAPTYMLVQGDDEVHCRSCPKPDDPLLTDLLTEMMDNQETD